MALFGNLQQIPNVVNQGNWMMDQSMLHPYLYLLNNKVWIMIAILFNSWMHISQIMQGLMNIGNDILSNLEGCNIPMV
jgi:hypothetical protein